MFPRRDGAAGGLTDSQCQRAMHPPERVAPGTATTYNRYGTLSTGVNLSPPFLPPFLYAEVQVSVYRNGAPPGAPNVHQHQEQGSGTPAGGAQGRDRKGHVAAHPRIAACR